MEKKYKVSLPTLIFNYFIIFIFVIAAVSLLFFTIFTYMKGPNWFIGLWILMVLIFLLPHGLKTPHTIIINKLNKITFKSLISEKVYDIKNLKSIKTNFGNSSYLIFKFENGKENVINNITNLYELIYNLKAINNDIETKGC